MQIVKEALKAYGMENARHEMIRHNENITCKVFHQGNTYALRIHQPIEGFCASIITNGKSDIDLFQSEIELLQYMRDHGFMELQKPILNLDGEYVTKLSNGIPAMLLTWVEGEPIKQEETGRYAEEIGELACKIHQAAEGFAGDRIEYDNALCDRMIEEIKKAVSLNHMAPEAGEKCISELGAIKAAQNRLESEFGHSIIHADLGFSNILVTEYGLVPIDFSLSGYGSLAQEAGMILSNYHDDESGKKLLAGFKKAGHLVHSADADIFLAYSVLLFICVQHNKVHKEEWFENALNEWCKELFVHGAG